MLDSYLYLLSIWIQILQLSLLKKKKYKITSYKKKKNPLFHVKITHSYPEISISFLIL